jgi:TatD DNase family protein
MFTDTHCHIHEAQFYETDRDAVYKRAVQNEVKMVLVGTSVVHSREAVEFSKTHDYTWAVVGVHPHDVKDGLDGIEQILRQKHKEVVGIGEIGLDYFYTHSPKDQQRQALEQQLQWAIDYDLPVSFHVRDAFDEFWPIFANFRGVRGVLHSFTDNMSNLSKALSEGLYIGVNGISTFTKDEKQREMFQSIPLTHMLLETDAPFLTPSPHRGKVNEPAFVRHVAEYHATQRGVELEHLARVTSMNASSLFSL